MENFLKIHISRNRIYGLDILRGVAIVSVLILHGSIFLPKKLAHYLLYITLDGVSIFFVLSGFLIGGILIKIIERENISFKVLLNFWSRRWFRTLPAYFLTLIILAVLQMIFAPDFSIWSIRRYFIFSQNLFSPHPIWFFLEAWSLSIEEWFYLIIPVCIFGLVGFFNFKNKNSLILVALSIIVTVTLIRANRYFHLSVKNIYAWDLIYRKQVATRLDSIMYGLIGAYMFYYHNAIFLKYKKLLLIAGIVLLFLTCTYQNYHPRFGLYFCVFSFSLNSLATLCLLPFLSDLKHGDGLIYKGVTYISVISYSMYLFNYSLVRNWMLSNVSLNMPYENAIKYFLFWVITIILSVLSYKYFEIPMMRLRDRKFFG